MRHLRVTIAGTMGLVALVALSVASFKSPTALAASGMFSLAVVGCFAATVAALSLSGRRRVIWGSFAICGAVYLALSLPWASSQVGPHLLTAPFIEVVAERLTGDAGIDGMTVVNGGHRLTLSRPSSYWLADLGQPNQSYASSSRLLWTTLQIAHSLLSLAAGSAGALFASFLTRSSKLSHDVRRDHTPHATPGLDDHP